MIINMLIPKYKYNFFTVQSLLFPTLSLQRGFEFDTILQFVRANVNIELGSNVKKVQLLYQIPKRNLRNLVNFDSRAFKLVSRKN